MSRRRQILSRLNLTCRDASRFVSQQMDRDLEMSERVGLSIHLALCGSCRRYRRQLELLRRVTNLAFRHPLPNGRCALSPEARERIRARLGTG